jgi:hypothetical protein
MPTSHNLRTLYNALKSDPWRKKRGNGFSKDIALVNKILFHPYGSNSIRSNVVSKWLQKYQPCLFGRIAAARGWLHYCVLTGEDFQQKSDQEIAHVIHRELLAWKRRSVRPTSGFSDPAHGFVLIATSDKLALAAPDEHLHEFATKLQGLWGCASTVEASGTLHWETLYLQDPRAKTYVQFSFSVDFFAAQGDRRWWHDHRVPGGLMFTANSVGHMRKYREWYQGMQEQSDWMLQTAMLTIDLAANTEFGKATWLKSLSPDGSPVLDHIKCPFQRPERVRKELEGKDWTRYGGYLHTDHSIRPEFFHEEAYPVPELTSAEYLQDFTYLYDNKALDHLRFIAGTPVAEESVVRALGPADAWGKIVRSPTLKLRRTPAQIDERRKRELGKLILECKPWGLTKQEISNLSEVFEMPT